MEEFENSIFELIMNAGDSKSNSMEAIQEAKKGNFEKADGLLKGASVELGKAHKFQTGLIQDEAAGKSSPISILLIHAQDHFMAAMTVKDLATEMVELYRRM